MYPQMMRKLEEKKLNWQVFGTGFADCDETYNYWEPLHFLVHGYGFQTWEYSPEFALRSYAFLLPFNLVARLTGRSALMFDFAAKLMSFYSVRIALALTSAIADAFLYDATVWRFGKPPARLLLVFLTASPGTFRASVELLPSSFAMLTLSVAFGSWMVGEFPQAIVLVALASLLGWPFVAVLGVPMAIHIMFRRGIVPFARTAIVSGLSVFLWSFCIDSLYYGEGNFPALTLLKYNVFPEPGTGSNLYGVEDWRFYAINLFLNLNVAVFFVALYPFLWIIDSGVTKVRERVKSRDEQQASPPVSISLPHLTCGAIPLLPNPLFFSWYALVMCCFPCLCSSKCLREYLMSCIGLAREQGGFEACHIPLSPMVVAAYFLQPASQRGKVSSADLPVALTGSCSDSRRFPPPHLQSDTRCRCGKIDRERG